MDEQGLRLLLVEDEKSFREQLAKYLRQNYQFLVDIAEDGRKALELIDTVQGRYDVALIDEGLPDELDGVSVLRLIKEKYPDIEVILFTGWGLDSALEALRAGAYRYFAKPFNLEELSYTIRFAAEQRQTRRGQRILAEISTLISSTLDLSEILHLTCQAAVKSFGVDHSGFVLFDQNLTYGRTIAEYPDLNSIGVESVIGNIIPVQGVPDEERLVFKKEILNINDVAGEMPLGPVREYLLTRKIQSILIVPVVLRNKVIASFSLDSISQKRVFYSHEVALCQSLANQVAVAIGNAQHLKEAHEGRDYLRSLYDASIAIISVNDPDKVLESVVNMAYQATGAWRTVVLLIDKFFRKTTRILAEASAEPSLEPAEVLRPNGISMHVINSREPFFVADIEDKNQIIPPNPHLIERGTKAIACLPLLLQGANSGVLWIEYRQPHNFSETEKQALKLFASQSAIAYENARRMDELEQMRLAAEAMANVIEPKEVLHEIVKSANKVLGSDFAIIWPYDPIRLIFLPEEMVAENIPEAIVEKLRKEEPQTGRSTRHVLEEYYVAIEDLSITPADFLGEPTRSFLEKLFIRSFQGIRLDIADETLGVLYVDYKEPHGFGESDRKILEHFANHASLTLKKARLLDQVNRSREAARVVARVSTLGNLEDTLNTIVVGAQNALHCNIATLYTFDEGLHRFIHARGIGCNPNNMRRPEDVPENSVLWKIINLSDRLFYASETAYDDELLKGHFIQEENIKSALGIQLCFGDNRVGVMFINFLTRHRFTDDEIKNTIQFGDQAAVAIRNAQLHDEIKKKVEVLDGLYIAGKAITSTLTLETTLSNIAEQALRIINLSSQHNNCFSHIALLEGNQLVFPAASSPKILALLSKHLELDLDRSQIQGIVGRCIKKGINQNVADVRQDPDYIAIVETTRSQLTVVLRSGKKIIGALSIEHPIANFFTGEDEGNLELLAAQATIAIENARQHEDLRTMKALVGPRTATEWMRMVSMAWGHAIKRESGIALRYLELIHQGVEKSDFMQVNQDLSSLTAVIERLKDIPIVAPLSKEDKIMRVFINSLVRRHIDRMWQNEPYKFAELIWDLQPDMDDTVFVVASPQWILRCAEVFIDNSINAMEGANSPVRSVKIKTQISGEEIEILVKDSGPGFSSQLNLETIGIEPIRNKPEGSRGAGLGLVLAKTIAQTFGGEIRIDNTGSNGTTMVISLPLERLR